MSIASTPGWSRKLLAFGLAASLFLSACASSTSAITSTDPLEGQNYVLVTANPMPTNTPFQPGLPSDAPPTQAAPIDNPQPSATLPATATDLTPLTDTPLPVLPTNTEAPAPTQIPTDTPQNLPTTPPLDTPTAYPLPANLVRPQYIITAMLDYAAHRVTVSETVLYPNRTAAQLASLPLAVNPNLWTGVFNLQSVSVNDQPSSDYTLSGQWLTVNLPTPLLAGQAVKLGFGYQLSLPYSAGKMENFGYTNRQTTLIDWYPFVPPYIDGKWVLPDPYPYGENLVYEKADFRVSLSFADPSYVPVVAASAPASNQNGALVYSFDNARNFTISASDQFQVSTANINGVTVVSYYFAGDGNAAARVLDMTRMAVGTYSTEFGPYAHGMLTVCETDLNDGLETDGLYFLTSNFYKTYDGTVRNNLSTIAVHETAHQWWYGAVANNQATEPWLDEAMATYSEHVFYEDNYPDLVPWWWAFRVDSKNPSGWVDSRIYDTSTFSQYVNAVYFDGAHFIQALRDRIGGQVFFAFLRDYYARENGRIATANDFFSILDLHTNADYSDLIKKYFYYR